MRRAATRSCRLPSRRGRCSCVPRPARRVELGRRPLLRLLRRSARPGRGSVPRRLPGPAAGGSPGRVGRIVQVQSQFVTVEVEGEGPVTVFNEIYPRLEGGQPLMVYPDGAGGWTLSSPAWWLPEDLERAGERKTCGSPIRFLPTSVDPAGETLLGEVDGRPAELAKSSLVGLHRLPVYPLKSLVGQRIDCRILGLREDRVLLTTRVTNRFIRRYAASEHLQRAGYDPSRSGWPATSYWLWPTSAGTSPPFRPGLPRRTARLSQESWGSRSSESASHCRPPTLPGLRSPDPIRSPARSSRCESSRTRTLTACW